MDPVPAGGRERIQRMINGYLPTGILRAAVELGVFARLAGSALSAEQLASVIGADPRGTKVLLDGLVALGLAAREGSTYSLVALSDQFLVPGRQGYLGDGVTAYANDVLWSAIGQLADAVRHGGSVLATPADTPDHRYWTELATAISAAPTAAPLVVDVLADWASHRPTLDVLDVACGNGTYGFAVASRFPVARIWSLDWPNVVAVARQHADRLGLAGRAQFIEGDMFEVPLGGPFDLAILSQVLHHFSPPRAMELLARVAAALKPDGRIVIHDTAAETASPTPEAAPYLFSVILLAWTPEGECHPLDRLTEMLSSVGCEVVAVRSMARTAGRVIVAQPAATVARGPEPPEGRS